MAEGEGFARRVTHQTLARFAALLGQARAGGGDPGGEDGDDLDAGNRPYQENPALADAEALFDGEHFHVKVSHRPPAMPSSRRGRRGTLIRTRFGAVQGTTIDPASFGPLIWELNPIDASTAQHPPNPNSRVTATLKLGVKGLVGATSHGGAARNQFRNAIFAALAWSGTPGGQEEAHANFRVEIDGTDLGEFSLRISHDPVREQNQNNVPTWLHWGRELGAVLRDQDYTGLRLTIQAPPPGKSEPFFLRIL